MASSLIDPERKKKLAKRIGWLVAKVMIGDLTKKKEAKEISWGRVGEGALCP